MTYLCIMPKRTLRIYHSLLKSRAEALSMVMSKE